MVAFVDAHGDEYGVEPICNVLPIAPSTYYEHKARQADPACLPPRVRCDAVLRDAIERGLERQLPGLRRPQGLATARS